MHVVYYTTFYLLYPRMNDNEESKSEVLLTNISAQLETVTLHNANPASIPLL